ncbi:MAG TPA: Ig-like domain-containing protein [Planctomycetota bacterium]
MEFRIRAARVLVLAAAIFCVPACGGSDDDEESLVVTFTSPANLDGGVPRQPVIYVRFNKPLKPGSVTEANFVLLNSLSAAIPRDVSYSGCLNEVRIVPDAALTKSAVYQVSLTSLIEATDDTTYAGGFFQFTIGTSDDADRPTFSGATAAGSPTSTSIALTWAAATDATSSVVFDVFLSTTTGCHDLTDAFLAGQPGPLGVTVTGLTAATTYFFVVRARDDFGNVDLNVQEQSATTLP